MWSPADTRTSDFVPVRLRRTFGDAGEGSVAMLTRCAHRTQSVEEHTCATCPDRQGVFFDPVDKAWYRLCWRKATDAAPPVDVPLGPDAPVAALLRAEVACVAPTMGVDSLVALFVERGLDAAPVVDPDGRPLGVVSKTDLLRERYEAGAAAAADPQRPPRELRDLGGGFHVEGTAAATAGDVMTPLVFALPEDASIARAAALMIFEGTHHIVVTGDGGRVVGMVSALDLARCLATERPAVAPQKAPPGSW